MADKFRLWAPKETFLPNDFPLCPEKLKEKTEPPAKKSKLNDNKNDSKKDNTRPIIIIPGQNHNASGSCYFEQGHTKVLVTVHGPQANTNRKKEARTNNNNNNNNDDLNNCLLTTFVKFTPFADEKRQICGPETQQEKLLSRKLSEALTPVVQLHEYPKMEIKVSALVIENDGGVLASIISASSVALANAGLKMYDLAVGINFGVFDDDENKNEIVVDPSNDDENIEQNVLVSYLVSTGQYSLFDVNVEMNMERLNDIMDRTVEISNKIYAQQADVLC